jgi:hypothetical protein
MMHSDFRNHRTGSFTGPVPLALLLLAILSLSPFVMAEKVKIRRVTDSILGVQIGSRFEDARAKLNPLSETKKRATEEEDEEEGERGRKEAWKLKGTSFTTIALKANSRGRVIWVTGFLRPGKEIPFSELGDISLAVGVTDSQAVWNVATPGGGYRLVAKGQKGRAHVIYLLSLNVPMK